MYKKLKTPIVVLLVAISLVSSLGALSSCTLFEKINSYDYIKDEFRYLEPYSDISEYYSVNKTVTDYASYYFDDDISLKKRNRFVTFSEQLLKHLGYVELDDKWLNFFVSNDIKTPRADTDEYNVYFSTSSTKTQEFIIYMLQVINTNTLNYGLLYGISARLYSELGWGKASNITSSKIATFLKKDSNRFILDLTYPVFHRKFSTKTQISYAKAISIKLVNYIEKTHGDSALDDLFEADKSFDLSFDNLFYGYLNEWLDTIKIAHIETNSEVLKCIPYTADFPIRILTISCDYYMEKNWEEDELQGFYEYQDFKSTYASVKKFLLRTEESYLLVRNFFSFIQAEQCPVLIKNIDSYSGHASGQSITINSLWALTHEFVHFICFLKYGYFQSWMMEAIAYYSSNIFDNLNSREIYFAYHNKNDYLKKTPLPDKNVFIIDNYIPLSDHENYYLRFINGGYHDKFIVNSESIENGFNELLNQFYFSVSFSDFLIETYGKEKYFELYKSFGNLSKTYSKTQSEIISDYLNYLRVFFSKM